MTGQKQAKKTTSHIQARHCARALTLISHFLCARVHIERPQPSKDCPMKMLIDLFSTDYGLMSLAVIVIMLLMAAFFLRMFVHKMNNNE
jgi:hypothetical protein